MADYARMKRAARMLYRRGKWELSLRTVFYAAGFMYTMNQIQCDSELEELICRISRKHLPTVNCQPAEANVVLYYDGFGQTGRGLTYIYLKALVQLGYRVKYVTYQTKKHIHTAAAELVGAENVFYICGTTFLVQMEALDKLLADSQAGIAFLYMNPDDVVAVGTFSHCPPGMKRYLINLTDHAFWLGINIADKVINFREFGGKICMEKRNISSEKMLYLPYYPGEIKAKWDGLPFSESQNKLIFSGGFLYKTESKDRGYYHLVEAILEKYKNVNFLYLGNGNAGRIKRLQRRYPARVAYAKERRDFFEIMKRCTFYLATYPYNGGLMTQYALLAGKVPVALNHPGIDPELSIRHEESFWNYDTLDKCLEEIGKLLEDDHYRHKREENLQRFLIGESEFTQELNHILQTGHSIRTAGERTVSFDGFQEVPLETISGLKYDRLFFRKKGLHMFRFFPIKYCLGMLRTVYEKW